MGFLSSLFKTKYNSISASELKEWMKNKDKFEIIDVRSKNEFGEGTIKGFKHYNLFDSSFKSRISKLDKSKKYVVYCRSGNRSRSACNIMSKSGFENVYNLKGGIMGWNSVR